MTGRGASAATRVLVTGANGFVGHHLCRRLARQGTGVVALVRGASERIDGLPGVDVARGDVLDAQGLAALCRRHGPIDGVAHLATEPPGAGPRRGTNTTGTARVLAAARDAGAGRFVFTSTMSVFDFLQPDLPLPLPESHPAAPRDAYGAEKLAAEQLCRAAGDDGGPAVTILRLAGVYGPGKAAGAAYAFLRAALTGAPIRIAADRAVDLVWIGDAVAAVVAALAAPPAGTVHVGSGRAVRLSDVALQAVRAAGPAASGVSRIDVDGSGNAFCLDIRRARECLGYTPTPLAAGLAAFLPAVAADLAPGAPLRDGGR